MPVSCSTCMRSTAIGGVPPNACCGGSPSRCWCRSGTTTPSPHGSTVAGSPSAGRQSGAKLVYERVPQHRVRLQPTAQDGLLLADCIDVREGQFEDYLRNELMKRADFRCTASLDEFRSERRAVTREGQVRSGDRHEKDDRHRVDDPRRWVLGWVNERKIAALQTELAELEHAREQASAKAAALERATRRGAASAGRFLADRGVPLVGRP